MSVLDASAVLALIRGETGADAVEASLPGSTMSSVNLAEVVGKVVDLGRDGGAVRPLLTAAGVEIVPFTAWDAEAAGAMRADRLSRALSLGDKCCLALGLRSDPPEVLTADRAWADLDLPVTVRLIR